MPHPVPCPTIIQTAESILRIESSKWIYHERALAKSLGLSADQLRSFTIPPSIPVMEISTAVLELVKKEIVDLFVKMFIIPSSALEQFTVLRRSTRNHYTTWVSSIVLSRYR